jgi:hypothetical protein
MGQVIEYKTPLAQVRGVFLCDSVADTVAVSALTQGISQEGWAADVILGDVDTEGGDLWLGY